MMFLLSSSPNPASRHGFSLFEPTLVMVIAAGGMSMGGSALATRNVTANPPTGEDGVTILCPSSGNDYNGTCGQLSFATDINGDGIDDLIMAVSNGNVTGGGAEGFSYVIYGKSVWTTPFDLGDMP